MLGHHLCRSYCILILMYIFFHIPMSSSIDVSFTPPIVPLIALSPQSLGHPFRDDVTTQMQYFPTPLVEQQGEAQVQDQGRRRGRARDRGRGN